MNKLASTNWPNAFPLYVLPPASCSFFTGAPGRRSRSSSFTQNVAGVRAESKITTRFVLSLTVRQMVDETQGRSSLANPSGVPTLRIKERTAIGA